MEQGSAKLLLSTAESNFLLVEANLRGWYAAQSASALYKAGIKAAMKQWAIIAPGDGLTSDLKINTYIKYHSFNTGGSLDDKMKQI